MKFLDNWAVKRLQNKQQKNAKEMQNKQSAEEIEVYKNLKRVYSFVVWLNTTGLKNRAERKKFWRKVKEGEPILETTLSNLIHNYAQKINSKVKKIKEGAVKKGGVNEPPKTLPPTPPLGQSSNKIKAPKGGTGETKGIK